MIQIKLNVLLNEQDQLTRKPVFINFNISMYVYGVKGKNVWKVEKQNKNIFKTLKGIFGAKLSHLILS